MHTTGLSTHSASEDNWPAYTDGQSRVQNIATAKPNRECHRIPRGRPFVLQIFARIGGDLKSNKNCAQSAAALCVQTALSGLHVVQRNGVGAAGEVRVRWIVGVQLIAARLP